MSKDKSLRGKIQFSELTDTGMVRDHNEDAIGTNEDMGIMILADGMGGYNAGEVASGIAVQTIADLAVEGAHREERNDIDPNTKRSLSKSLAASTSFQLNNSACRITAIIVPFLF